MSLRIVDEHGAEHGEVFWHQQTVSQPVNELAIRHKGSVGFSFNADEFLSVLAEVPLDKRTSRVLTHYLAPEEAKFLGMDTITRVDAFQWDPTHKTVLSIGTIIIGRRELGVLIYWLLSQVAWVQESHRPLRSFNAATREKLETLARWAREE